MLSVMPEQLLLSAVQPVAQAVPVGVHAWEAAAFCHGEGRDGDAEGRCLLLHFAQYCSAAAARDGETAVCAVRGVSSGVVSVHACSDRLHVCTVQCVSKNVRGAGLDSQAAGCSQSPGLCNQYELTGVVRPPCETAPAASQQHSAACLGSRLVQELHEMRSCISYWLYYWLYPCIDHIDDPHTDSTELTALTSVLA